MQVRDSAIDESERMEMPQSDVGLGFLTERRERDVELHGALPYGKMNKEVEVSLLQYVRRSALLCRLLHVCGCAQAAAEEDAILPAQPAARMFLLCEGHVQPWRYLPVPVRFVSVFFRAGSPSTFARGRHEMPTTGELAKQNIKDRYYGHNDPVANKMMRRVSEPGKLPDPPADQSITTIWVGGIDAQTTEHDLRYARAILGGWLGGRRSSSSSQVFVLPLWRNRLDPSGAGQVLCVHHVHAPRLCGGGRCWSVQRCHAPRQPSALGLGQIAERHVWMCMSAGVLVVAAYVRCCDS